jgi:hypothetical protein
MQEYENRGFKTLYLPFGSNDRLQGKTESDFSGTDLFEGVRYLGSPIVDRPKLLGHLYTNGIPVEIYGNHWNWYPRQPTPRSEGIQVKQNGFRVPGLSEKSLHDTTYYFAPRLKAEGYSFLYGLWQKLKKQWFPEKLDVEAFYAHLPTWVIHGEYAEDDFVRLVRTTAINVGFTHLHVRKGPHTHQKQIRLRDVEIPMTGGFLLAEACDETELYFTPGKHLDTFRDENELLEKSRWYLDHPAERVRIAEAGRVHALSHHTWKHRFGQLLDVLYR